jgi:hypothetical protein
VNVTNNDSILSELDKEIRHQRTWRNIMSVCYFSSSALAIALSGSASVVAGLGHSAEAAMLAASATILLGVEKTLMFREKWLFHLSSQAQLHILNLNRST